MLCNFYSRRFQLLSAAVWLLMVAFLSESGCVVTRIYDDTETEPGRDTGMKPSSDDTEIEQGSDDAETESNSDSEPQDTIGKETDTTEQTCPKTLDERMTIHSVAVDEDINYLTDGYDFIIKTARITLARQPDGNLIVAWLNAAQDTVHITPLTQNYERRSSDDDITIEGADIGGLVAHNDGFALLTSQLDNGVDVAAEEEDRPVYAAVWVRYWYDSEKTLVVPLTGSESPRPEFDYSNSLSGLRGSLLFDGERYGAYFEIRGGLGDDTNTGSYGDKMVFIDETGAIQDGGWRFVMTLTGTTSLLNTPDGLAAFAFPWFHPEGAGLHVIWGQTDTRLIAKEKGGSGYSGGEFGGIVSLSGTNIVVWASRGYSQNEAEYDTHDVVMMTRPEEQTGEPLKLTQSPDIDEINVHGVPYGDDQLLIMWDEIEPTSCPSGTCFGSYGGTFVQLFDVTGEPVSSKERIEAPPTLEHKIVQFENGDVAYAFVTDTMDYSTKFHNLGSIPPMRTLRIAHLAFCTEENSQ